MWIVLLISVVCAIAAWIVGRPQRWLFPSDCFFIVCIVTMGFTPLLNPGASHATASYFEFSGSTIDKAFLGLSIMYFIFAFVWLVRRRIRPALLFPEFADGAGSQLFREDRGWLGMLAMAAIALVAISFVSATYYEYKIDVLGFLTGDLTGNAYAEARRYKYAGNTFIEGVVGRLRYSLYPMLFMCALIYTYRMFGLAVSMAIGSILFVFGPASMSKAPIFIYAGYALIVYLVMKGTTWSLKFRNALPSAAIGIPIFILALSAAYFMQYQGVFSTFGDIPDAVTLAMYRVFVSNYTTLLQTFETYPEFISFAGFSSITSLSILGIEPRNIDAELAFYYIGSKGGGQTSFPTIFIGNGYASFGYAGIVFWSFFVAIYLAFLDHLLMAFRNAHVRLIYYAGIMLNVTFFASLAAPPVLLTYGCAVIPMILFAVETLRIAKEPRRLRRGPAIHPRLVP